MSSTLKISAVIPVVQRFDDLSELYAGYSTALEGTGHPYEIVFVVDGGAKETLPELRKIKEKNDGVTVVTLAKYFGESMALTAGFDYASGDLILTLPAYHQIEPSEIRKLIASIDSCDMAIAKRWPRAGSWFESLRRNAFHLLLKVLSGERYEDLGCSVRLFKRQVVSEVTLYGDLHRFFPILVSRQGFVVREVDVAQSPKDVFRGRYRVREYLHRVLDIFTVFFLVRFTKKPLRFFGMVGSLVSALGGATVLITVIQRIFLDMPLADRPALLLGSLLLVLGVQTFALGLIGELIIFTHAAQLKEYTIAEIIN